MAAHSTSDDPDKDISTLFKLLQGDLDSDHAEVLDVLQKASNNIVTTQQGSDVEMEFDEDGEDLEDKNDSISATVLSTSDHKAELTTTYINGEISLDEFMELLEKDSQEEESNSISKDSSAPAEFEKEFEAHRKKQYFRRRKKLPKHLQGLMGEANLRLARGDHEEAIKMCMEIVRSAPTAAEPFQTLGMLYEELGESHKSFQFFLIGAYLSPNDLEEWVRLAEIAVEQGYHHEAVRCYTKAIRLDSHNNSLVWERCNLYKQLGEKKKALDGYLLYLSNINEPDQGEMFLKLSREIAMCYHEDKTLDIGINTMKRAIEKYPADITSEDVNLLLELLINQKLYYDAVKALIDYCGVQLLTKDSKIDDEHLKSGVLTNFNSCILPDVLPIDLRVKLAVCIIHLKGIHLVKEILEPLSGESTEEMGDLFLDVAEAFMDVGEYQEALPFLSSLAATEAYNMAGVWLKYGECLNAVGDIDRAVNAYKTVVALAPGHLAARISLSSSLQQLGRTNEALLMLSNDAESESKIDLQLLFQKCTLLFSQNMLDEFIKTAKIIISADMETLKNANEVNCALSVFTLKHRIQGLHEHRVEANEPVSNINPNLYTNSVVQSDELWKLHQKVCSILFKLKRYSELESWTISTLMSNTLHRELDKGKDINFMVFLALLFNRSWDSAYGLLKHFCIQEINSNRAWNLFSYVANNTQSVRHNKFCIRMSLKNQDHIALSLLNGHCAMVAGSYKHALGEYMNVFKETPSDPFVTFCIGLILTNMTAQKFTANKNSLVIQAFAFLNQYMEVRGTCQESYYNLGRAMHILGLNHAALFYYKKTLATPVSVVGTPEVQELFDLKREAAYNLSLIYQQSGAMNLAKYYIRNYCVI